MRKQFKLDERGKEQECGGIPVKLEAGTDAYHFIPMPQQWIPIDVRTIFRQLNATDIESSLNYYLKKFYPSKCDT